MLPALPTAPILPNIPAAPAPPLPPRPNIFPAISVVPRFPAKPVRLDAAFPVDGKVSKNPFNFPRPSTTPGSNSAIPAKPLFTAVDAFNAPL